MHSIFQEILSRDIEEEFAKAGVDSSVRSPTSTETSTEAYTADNFTATVTGGAGAGNTTVSIQLPDGAKKTKGIAKANLDNEPSEMRAKMPVSKGASVVDRSKPDKQDGSILERAIDMSDDAHHSGDELEGEEDDPIGGAMSSQEMVDHPRSGGESDGMGDKDKGDMSKSDRANSSFSETSAAGIAGADRLSGGSFSISPEDYGTEDGMPNPDDGRDVILSDDDVSVEQEMRGKTRPIESTVPHGSADLGENKTMSGNMYKAEDGQRVDYGARARAAAAAQLRKSVDQYVSTFTQEGSRQAQEQPEGRNWVQGGVHYSTGEDERIARSMETGSGYGHPEPALGWQNQMTKSSVCNLCKSSVPTFLTVCPCCGGGAGVHSGGGLVMEKSVKQSLSAPKSNRDLVFADGSILIPNE